MKILPFFLAGLFHKAIIQSGTYFNPWAQPAHKGVPAKRANKVGELLGCNTKPNDWKNLLKCLHGKSAENITATVYDFFVSTHLPFCIIFHGFLISRR